MIQSEINTNIYPIPKKGNFSQFMRMVFFQGFLSLIITTSFIAGIWTLIPSNWLLNESIKVNILGYSSHCPFAPFSSAILFGISVLGTNLMNKYELTTLTGYSILLFGMIASVLGIIEAGIGIATMVFGAIGIALGMILIALLMLFLRFSNESTPT